MSDALTLADRLDAAARSMRAYDPAAPRVLTQPEIDWYVDSFAIAARHVRATHHEIMKSGEA
jgi:hypothetical protein